MTSIEETTAAQVVAAVAHEMASVALAETSEATEAAPPEPKLGARRARRAKADAATATEANATEAAASAAEMRRGRKPNTAEASKQVAAAPFAADRPQAERAPTKLDRLIALLSRPAGASLAEMMTATSWRAHSVRGAMAGSLRKRGHAVASARDGDGVRRYRIGGAA